MLDIIFEQKKLTRPRSKADELCRGRYNADSVLRYKDFLCLNKQSKYKSLL